MIHSIVQDESNPQIYICDWFNLEVYDENTMKEKEKVEIGSWENEVSVLKRFTHD